jgi:glutathionyl-hydroquinone reductase
MTSVARHPATRFATPIDAFAYGEHPMVPRPDSAQPFSGRITAGGSGEFPAESHRYHLYAGRFCPRSHRAIIALALSGFSEFVSVSYVDGLRDGRGWAFRERTGPDPVNGFTLLREAYEATRPGYAGNVSLPVLWDRQTGRIVSNDANTIDIDLATAFAGRRVVDLYPQWATDQIEVVSRRIAALDRTVVRAVYVDEAKDELRTMLREFDRTLSRSRYLLGETISLADVRLWVRLVRYDVGANAHGAAGPRLATFESLPAYVRDLYDQPAFRDSTDFKAFAAPLTPLPSWVQASERSYLSTGIG